MLTKAGYTVKSDLQALNDLQEWFRQLCHCAYAKHHAQTKLIERQGQRRLPPRFETQVYRLNLALAEGFTNAVRHAHAHLPEDTTINVEVALGKTQVEIQIWDAGRPFDPSTVEEPQPGTLRKGGYGWFLIRRLVDRVSYDRYGNRNCLKLQKAWT